MAVTLAAYRELCRRLLGAPPSAASRHYPDARIDAAIGRAMKRIVRRAKDTDFYTVSVDADLETGNIAVPDDLLTDLSVIYQPDATTSATLTRRTEKAMDEKHRGWRVASAQSGHPTCVVWRKLAAGAAVYVYPQPTATVTDGLAFRYVQKPVTTGTGDARTYDVLDLFSEYEELLPAYMAAADLAQMQGGAGAGLAVKYTALAEAEYALFLADLNSLMTSPATQGGR